MTTDIEHLINLGYSSELVLVCPPNAAGSIAPKAQGKAPARWTGNGWAGDRDWVTRAMTPELAAAWVQLAKVEPVNVGIRAARYPAIDIDVLDPAAVAKIAALARQIVGDSPSRIGQPPKELLAYRLAPGASTFPKRKIHLGALGHVEILGDGQQYLVAGQHRDTLQPYHWTAPMLPAHALPAIDTAAVDRFCTALEALAREEGWDYAPAARSPVQTVLPPVSGTPDPAAPPNVERYRAALVAVGNNATYDEWIAIGAGIRAALGDAGEAVFTEWSNLYAANTPAEIAKRWRSFTPPYRVDGEWVLEWCRARGYVETPATAVALAAAVGVTPAPAGAAPAPPVKQRARNPVSIIPGDVEGNLPTWLTEWVWVSSVEMFVNLKTAEMVPERVAARLWAHPGVGPDHKENPAKLWFQSPARQIYQRLTFEPGRPAIVNGAVNTWREPATYTQALAATGGFVVPDVLVQTYIDHVRSIVPDPTERGLLFDWMSYVVQNPTTKPNWAVFLGSLKQGIGKDLLLQPMYHACGKDYTRTVRPQSLLSEFNEWVVDARLVIVEEAQDHANQDTVNNMKMYITRPPDMVPVNRKMMRSYEVPNVGCFWFMSNFRNALALEPDDRRFFVLWSDAQPKSQSYSVQFAKWMDAHMDLLVAWLATRRIDPNFDPWRAPWTDAKASMIDAGRGEFDAVFLEMWRSGLAPFHHSLVTTTALWDALPEHVKRTRRASVQRMNMLLEQQGAVRLMTANRQERRVDLDRGATTGRAFGKSVIYALSDPLRWSAATNDELRAEFRRTWAPGTGADGTATLPAPAVAPPPGGFAISQNMPLTAPAK